VGQHRKHEIPPRAWTPDEEELLRNKYDSSSISDIAAELRRTASSVKTRSLKLGLRRGRQPWSKEEDDILRKLYPHMSTKDMVKELPGRDMQGIYRRACHYLGLRKTQEYLDSPAACRLRRGDKVGSSYRYPKGHVPANKGLRRPGYSTGRGRMKETQFKKGERAGAAQRKWCPVGTIKQNADGYLRRKIADEPESIAGKGAHSTNWEFVHRRVWEDANGPIPEGYRIWWKDGDHLNCALENLELLSAKEHMARTTIHNLPPQIKELLRLKGAIRRQITYRSRDASKKQNVRSA
jgi:hypothetical protein